MRFLEIINLYAIWEASEWLDLKGGSTLRYVQGGTRPPALSC